MKTTNWLCAVAMFGGCATSDEVAIDHDEQAASGTKFQTTFDNGAADTMYFDPAGGGGLMLFANSGTAGDTLFFDRQGPDPQDPFGSYALRGSGVLPAGALQISAGGTNARLVVTIPADFYVERCTFDMFGGFVCHPTAERPSFDLTWSQSDWWRSYRKGVEEQTSMGTTIRTKGTYWTSSANVSGLAIDLNLVDGPGMVNESRGTQVTREVL